MGQVVDMTGWKMWEHGVPGSRLIIIERVDDYISPQGKHCARWLCECTCDKHKKVIGKGTDIRNGHKLSCGCVNADRRRKENYRDLSGQHGILWTTNTNKEVYFDLSDANEILKHCWYENDKGYAVSNIGDKCITMHKFLGYYLPDHNNQNKLDNRRENLIPCTKSDNAKNYRIRKDTTSGVKGVSWDKKSNKWYAYIHDQKKRKSLGYFINKEDAIKARLRAEKEFFKEFAGQRYLFEQYNIE